jgi:histidine triad (HIT) family protein
VAKCVFCEIVAGARPQDVVYSDSVVVAFLCEPPATWGHTLVVPRAHRDDIWTVRREESTAAMDVARRLAHVMRDRLGATGINIRQNSGSRAGQDVFHFHLHVVPRYDDDTVLPGCVWGVPPWEPPSGGRAEQRRVAGVLRGGLAGELQALE